MEKVKISKGRFGGNVVKVNFQLEFNVNENSNMTPKQVKDMIDDMDRTDLGEIVLNYLKTGMINEAGISTKKLLDLKGNFGEYPIKVKLKDRLFDIDLAQDYFSKTLLLDNDVFLSALFYFTPYQIMDPNKTLKLIKNSFR